MCVGNEVCKQEDPFTVTVKPRAEVMISLQQRYSEPQKRVMKQAHLSVFFYGILRVLVTEYWTRTETLGDKQCNCVNWVLLLVIEISNF